MADKININGINELDFTFSGSTSVSVVEGIVSVVNTAPVLSVFGRTGVVVAQSGDYTAAQVTNAASVAASNTFTAPQTIAATTTSSLLTLTTNSLISALVISNTNTSNYTQMQYLGTGTGSHTWQTGTGNGIETAFGVSGKYYFYDSTAAAMRAAIDTSGNLGIGHTTPYPTTFPAQLSVGTSAQFQVDSSGNCLATSLATSQTPTASATASDHSMPIVLGGVTYYIRLSATP